MTTKLYGTSKLVANGRKKVSGDGAALFATASVDALGRIGAGMYRGIVDSEASLPTDNVDGDWAYIRLTDSSGGLIWYGALWNGTNWRISQRAGRGVEEGVGGTISLSSLQIEQKDTSTTALRIVSAGPSYTAVLLQIVDTAGAVRVTVNSAGSLILLANTVWQAIGDAYARVGIVNNPGALQFGSGAAATDVSLGRTAANTVGMASGDMLALDSGATGSRPTAATVGAMWYDTTLHKPIWWDGTNWRDAAGSVV